MRREKEGESKMTDKKPPQFYRQRFLLALLSVFGKKLTKTDFQKYLFLYQKEYQQENQTYFFVPYKYGPFSFQSYADLRRLEEIGFIQRSEILELKDDYDYTNYLKENDQTVLAQFYHDYKNLKGNDLIRYVYIRYPYYASKSLIADKILGNVSSVVKNQDETSCLFSLGYEGITIDQYLDKILFHNIKMVVDVRKNPVSMKYGFSGKTLKNSLQELNIEYCHLPELGIDSQERQNLSSLEDYRILFDSYEKNTLVAQKKSLSALNNLYCSKKRIALTCFEKDYRFCHRSKITDWLKKEYGIKAWHL